MAPGSPPPLPAPYDDLGRLLLPPSGRGVGTRGFDPHELEDVDADQVLWGRPPTEAPAARGGQLLHAARTRGALLRVRRPRGLVGFEVVRVHRLPPGGPPGGRVRDGLRQLLRGGTLVELTRGPVEPRVLDEVARQAGVEATGRSLAGAGGSVLQPARRRGAPVMLRIGVADSAGDPARAAAGLRRVAGVAGLPAPVPLAEGRHTPASGTAPWSASWSVETRLPGRTPTRLTPVLLTSAVEALARMPATRQPAGGAGRDDLRRIAAALPSHAEALARLEPLLNALDHLPGVVGHGDVWTGNLLQERGRLTGLVDWDAWREDTAPGTDLLQLFATGWRLHLGLPLGAIWERAPWRHPTFVTATARYWRQLGLRPGRAELDALGLAWWAREVAGTLTRFPATRDDTAWLAANVAPVLATGLTRNGRA